MSLYVSLPCQRTEKVESGVVTHEITHMRYASSSQKPPTDLLLLSIGIKIKQDKAQVQSCGRDVNSVDKGKSTDSQEAHESQLADVVKMPQVVN